MDDFEKAIRVVFSQGPSVEASVRQQANAYCDSIKSQPDSWRFCWEQFLQRDCLEVKFWCLQVIPQVIPSLPVEARLELRSKVLCWLRDVAPKKQEEVAIRNKVALVYVVLLKLDYPGAWPTGWKDLLGLLDQGPVLVDMFLRILAIFDQEVVNDEVPRSAEDRQRSQMIKHAMREHDVMQLAESWYVILGAYRQSSPQLVIDCLKAVSVYIVWVEILTVANAKFLGAICGLIAEAGPPATEACDCLAAVLSKKMPAGKKVQMLQQLEILRRLDQCNHRNSTDLQLLEKEAGLFNAVGEVALEAYFDLRLQADAESAALAQAAWEFVKALMPYIFWFFSHQEYQIADSVEPFLTQFFVKIKTFVNCGDGDAEKMDQRPCHTVSLDDIRPILQQTLQLIIQRISWPDWFQHNDPNHEDDERHVAFIEFRRSLTKIFKRIFLVDDQMGFLFVQASIAQLAQRLSAVRPMEVEAVLYLYKEAGEIIKDVDKHLQANGPLATCFVQILECEALIKAEHWAIQLALIEVYVRYGRIFASHPDLFPKYGHLVLEAFVGRQGIRSSDARVVTRACQSFSKFIKFAKQQIVPLAVQIYEAVRDLLVVQYIPSSLMPAPVDGIIPRIVIKGTLSADDRGCLYEAIASLVTSMPPEQMRPALQTLLKQPAGGLSDMLNAPTAKIASDVHGYAVWAASSIETIATVSKAFSQGQPCVAPDWEEALVVVAQTLDRFKGPVANAAGLWRAVLFLCRRMVEVMGDKFLGSPLDALLPMLYSGADLGSLNELTIFAHHLVTHYAAKAQPFLQKWLEVLFLRPYEAWRQMPEGSDQLKREKLELGCNLLQLLKESAQKCPVAVLEPMLSDGSRMGKELVGFLLMGLEDPGELRALLLASAAWSALLDVAVSNQATQEAMVRLPLAQLLQQLLWSTFRMDFADVASQKILGESAAVLRNLTSARMAPGLRQQAMEALQVALGKALPGLRNDAVPRLLCEGLSRDISLKDVRAGLQQTAAEWRRDTGWSPGR